nr:Retrovirus-related Pol polyprotein from transposon RE2 [Ipomoea batatas]
MSSTGIKETSDSVENIISSSVFVPNLSGNLVITSEKLCGSQNYHSWSDVVEMWFMGQGVSDHLEKGEEKVPENEKAIWKRVDAQLCSLLWQSLSPELIQLFRVFKSCVEVWNQAKSLYTNDVSQCYTVVNNLVNLKKDGPEFENTRNQILGDNVVPGIQELFKRLLQVTSFPGETSAPTTDQSALVIQGSRAAWETGACPYKCG